MGSFELFQPEVKNNELKTRRTEKFPEKHDIFRLLILLQANLKLYIFFSKFSLIFDINSCYALNYLTDWFTENCDNDYQHLLV